MILKKQYKSLEVTGWGKVTNDNLTPELYKAIIAYDKRFEKYFENGKGNKNKSNTEE